MAYLYRHSSEQRDILIDSTPILWDSNMTYDMESSFQQSKRGVFYKAFTALNMAYYYQFYSWGWSWY